MRGSTWLLLGKLGSSFAQVVTGEWRAVRAEMRRSARISAGAMVALALAMAFLVVALVGIMFAAVEGLSTVIPRWAGFLAVALVMGAVAAALILRARSRLGDVETPDAVMRRRWRDHRAWMRRQLQGESAEDGE